MACHLGGGSRRRSAGIARALAACIVFPAASAHAGAWVEPPGQGQIIVTTAFTKARGGFDTKGKFIRADAFRKLEAVAYAEVGVTERITAVGRFSLSDETWGPQARLVDAKATGSEIGMRYHLGTFRDFTFAVQADGILPSLKLGRDTALLADANGGADLLLLSGVSFPLFSWASFVDADVGYRRHAGPAPDEWHGDVSFGTRPVSRLLFLLQAFQTISVGSGRPPFSRYDETKLEASAVYDLTAAWSVQLGLLATVAGRNAPRERGLVAGAWRRF